MPVEDVEVRSRRITKCAVAWAIGVIAVAGISAIFFWPEMNEIGLAVIRGFFRLLGR